MMDLSSHPANHDTIKALINSFADHEPPFSSLGTPFLADTEATQALVRWGEAAIPQLMEALDSGSSKIVMYASYCLGLIGDQTVLPALERTLERFEAKQPKEEHDFGVISATSRAIEKLTAPSACS